MSASKRTDATALPVLSPLRDVLFHGFSTGAGAFANDLVQVVAVHQASNGVNARHELWSHAPARLGDTSQSLLFTAHDAAFTGFEITMCLRSALVHRAFSVLRRAALGPC